jgi:hypothetical protein
MPRLYVGILKNAKDVPLGWLPTLLHAMPARNDNPLFRA